MDDQSALRTTDPAGGRARPAAAGRAPIRRGAWAPAALAALAGYCAIGLFPITPVEGDDIAIANACGDIAAHGFENAAIVYRYDVQPGTYALVLAACKLTGADPYAVFAALAAAGGVVFLWAGAGLVSLLTGAPPPLCAIAMIVLFPETVVSAWYANSTVVAGAFGAAGLLLLARRAGWPRVAAGGVLIGLAAWCRMDFGLMAPACLPLLYRGDRRRALWQSGLAAVIAAAVCLAAAAASGADLAEVFRTAGGHETSSSRQVPAPFAAQAVRGHLAFFRGAAVFLLAVGAVSLSRRRTWRPLVACAAGLLPLWVFYAGKLNSPKYLYYAIPFLAALCVHGAAAVAGARGRARLASWTAAGLLLAGQFLLGARVSLRAKPWIRQPDPTVATLFSLELQSGPIDRLALVIGAGTAIPTADSQRLSTGLLFSPVSWHRMKARFAEVDRKLTEYVSRMDDPKVAIQSQGWIALQLARRALWRGGWRPAGRPEPLEHGAWLYRWRKGQRRIVHVAGTYTGYRWAENLKLLELSGAAKLLYVCHAGRYQQMLLSNAPGARELFGFRDLDSVAVFELPLGGGPGGGV